MRFGKCLHLRLSVSWDGISAAIQLRGSILVELYQAEGKQLHQFACVVLIGDLPGRRFGAVECVEINPHAGRNRNVVHDGLEVRERILREHVVVVSDRGCVVGIARNYEELTQRKSNALPKLVRTGKYRLPPL